MKDFYRKVKDTENKSDSSKGGAMFFGVSRGKVSEGIDFADENGRAVVICGLPFPSVTDPKVVLENSCIKLFKGNKNKLRGNDWYQQQSSRAVNQAIGRVIRHKDDFGAIILCDERFANKANQLQLSTWLHPVIQVFPNFGESVKSLSLFFKRMTTLFPNNVKPTLQNVDNLSSMNELKKSPNGVDFNDAKAYLKKVKQKLDKTEYQYFIALLREIKQTSHLSGVVKQLKDLFSSPNNADSRADLLDGFISFIPESKRQIYKQLLYSNLSNDSSPISNLTSKLNSAELTTSGVSAIDVDLSVDENTQEKTVYAPRSETLETLHKTSPLVDTHQKRANYDLITGQQISKQKTLKKLKLSNPISEHSVDAPHSPILSPSSLESGVETLEMQHVPLNGVPQDYVDKGPSQRAPILLCPVCRDNPKEALSSRCGHVCCSSCWESALSEKLECPVCRTRTRFKQLTKLYFT